MLLADADTTQALTLGGGFAAFLALVGWILKSALPSLLQDFGQRLDKIQATHDAAVQKIQTAHDNAIQAARIEFRDELKATRTDAVEMRREFLAALEKMRVTQEKTADAVDALTLELRSMQACHTADRGPNRNPALKSQ